MKRHRRIFRQRKDEISAGLPHSPDWSKVGFPAPEDIILAEYLCGGGNSIPEHNSYAVDFIIEACKGDQGDPAACADPRRVSNVFLVP